MRQWEIIADNLSKAGWSLGWVSAVDSEERALWIVDAHRDNGKRFVVHADDKLTAFLELEKSPANHWASKMPNDSAQFSFPTSTLTMAINPIGPWTDPGDVGQKVRYNVSVLETTEAVSERAGYLEPVPRCATAYFPPRKV